LLGINRAFLCELCEVVIGENVDAYPELGEKKDYILKVISMEEERFDATIDAGLSILSDLIRGAVAGHADTISGEEVFKLYDTFGFPIDITREIAEENGLKLDEETFMRLMKQQKVRAREARANIGGWDESSKSVLSDLAKTEFTGYTDYRSTAKVIAILTDDGSVQSVDSGDCSIVLDRTPFYGEGGGQVGDTGTIYSEGFIANVYDTKKTDGVYVHLCTVANGSLKVGDEVTADIEDAKRDAIRRNHSACHLLQAALRAVLGSHVEQAGSYVSDEICRFDFTHFAALTSEEIAKVESLVNLNILTANEITTMETDIETARQNGAMALFGEKYGKVVRMVKMGNFSTELCGGTHCDNTGKIGLFKIISESSVAAGVRRIEAVTGLGVLKLIANKDALIGETASVLKVQNHTDIAKRATAIEEELRAAKKEIEALNAKLASGKLNSILASAVSVGSFRLIAARLDDMQADAARALADDIKANYPDTVAVLAINGGGKLNFIAVAGKDAVAGGAHAGKLVGAVAAVTGGKGGGRPDNAMAGGKDASKIDEALTAAKTALEGMLR
ncbi:MAG: alanine--tRNA ligase, partial [Clostridia bacterium]|nr:alanine--tRNA ligase [Clostridia bacterium]